MSPTSSPSGKTGVSGCVDIDECEKDHGCHRFADCENTPGEGPKNQNNAFINNVPDMLFIPS